MKKAISKISKDKKINPIKKDDYVTSRIFKKEIEKIDKRFDEQTTTILNRVDRMLKEHIHNMEVLFENKKDEDRIFFIDGLNDKELKISNLNKRVTKLENNLF